MLGKGIAVEDCVLIVEDDADIVEILRLYLEGSGYQVVEASNGTEGLERLRSHAVSIALVDIMMPGMNGFDFIKKARKSSNIPIIILSARNQPSDKMVGLDLGADGYITKPFDPMEVLAYIRAALRRCQPMGSSAPAHKAAGNTISTGAYEIDLDELVLRKQGVAVPLTASELKLAMKLMSAPGHVFSKSQLYEAISGSSYGGGEESVMMHISNIRTKIEDDPAHPKAIVTVRGLGYKFEG
jgi:DNA-binding response OmpR family regulator